MNDAPGVEAMDAPAPAVPCECGDRCSGSPVPVAETPFFQFGQAETSDTTTDSDDGDLL